jgi:glutaredoxin 3
MVKLYSISDCPWCAKVKKYLESKGVDYDDVDVEEDMEGRKELISLTKQESVPTTYVDGSFVVGFEKEQLDKLLDL